MATMVNDLHPASLVDAVDVAVYRWATPSTAQPLILPALAYISSRYLDIIIFQILSLLLSLLLFILLFKLLLWLRTHHDELPFYGVRQTKLAGVGIGSNCLESTYCTSHKLQHCTHYRGTSGR